MAKVFGQGNVAVQPTEQAIELAQSFQPDDLDLAIVPVTLEPDRMRAIEQQLAQANFLVLKPQDVAIIGAPVEKQFHACLDGFLQRVNGLDNPRLFNLVKKLNEEVDKEKLDELATKVLEGELGMWDKIVGFFSSKSLKRNAEIGWENTKNLVQGRTRNLVDVVNRMAKDLDAEQRTLFLEIQNMDKVKEAYENKFIDFVEVVIFASAFLKKAKRQVEDFERNCNPNDILQKRECDDLKDKLQALESRALALEGVMTKLPADHLVLSQLQKAAISTLQETATTAATRFGNIKMTLITINSAMVTKGVQKLAAQGAALDSNLDAVRSKMMNQVVTTAATAPGDNRLAQAEQLKKIVEETKALDAIVEQARVTNSQKFSESKVILEGVRKELLGLNP